MFWYKHSCVFSGTQLCFPGRITVLSQGTDKIGLSVRGIDTGGTAMEVSAMGFGCMGLNYHRSEHPDERMAIRLVHEAIERGVTLFDTAESYGPYTNEALVGKAPFIIPIPGTTKLSHLEENLRAAGTAFTPEEMQELEKAVEAIPVVGSRYDAVQESKIEK